ncbi:hypothetical protein V2G26_020582 [Clonostachys chloroleuca]
MYKAGLDLLSEHRQITVNFSFLPPTSPNRRPLDGLCLASPPIACFAVFLSDIPAPDATTPGSLLLEVNKPLLPARDPSRCATPRENITRPRSRDIPNTAGSWICPIALPLRSLPLYLLPLEAILEPA